MAKKDHKRGRHAAVKPAKARHPAHHNSQPKESAGASEAEVRRLDREILKLASRRAALTVKLIESQSSPQKSLFSPIADEPLIELIEKANPGPLPEPAVRGLFRELICGARSVVKALRIVYLGPAFSFTHLAAIERFGTSSTFIPVSSIAAVFEE